MHICKKKCIFAAKLQNPMAVLHMRCGIVIVLALVCMQCVQAANSVQSIKLPQVRSLEAKGWQIQHSAMSFDSLSIYISAKTPESDNYDLYVLHAEGWRWGNPQRLDALSSAEDELWPSITSDERYIYYTRRTPAVEGDRRSYEKTRICRGTLHAPSPGEPIIISGDEDSRPQILEDNTTLLFLRRAKSKKHDGAWENWYSQKIDGHNWLLPDTFSLEPVPQPIQIVTGTLTYALGGRPLGTGRVLVYNAITQELLQKVVVHSVTGQFRIALTRGEQYRLDMTAEGFSHHYAELDTRGLEARKETNLGRIPLSEILHITFKLYDSETQAFLGEEKKRLQIDSIHSIPLLRKGYRDSVIVMNTERQVLFAETELDIQMQPQKSMHHIDVINAKTGASIPSPHIRLNGHPSRQDTALRLEQPITLQISATGFLFYDTLFNSGKDEETHTIQVALQPLEKDLVLQLRNIQFAYDSYELTADSYHELNQLLNLLQQNPTLRIELSAHTDDTGNDRYNDKLSTLRGETVQQWLISQGIESSRIQSKGYGKRKPLVPNTSDENRALNRRVEIKVIEY